MKKNIGILILVFLIFTIFYNYYFPSFLIVGEYVAHIEDDFATFGIDDGDNLILRDNGTFSCDAWGNGTYVINGSKISFDYAGGNFQTYFRRPFFFGIPRIVVFLDLKSEFIKK